MLRRLFLACIHYGGVSGGCYACEQSAQRFKLRQDLAGARSSGINHPVCLWEVGVFSLLSLNDGSPQTCAALTKESGESKRQRGAHRGRGAIRTTKP